MCGAEDLLPASQPIWILAVQHDALSTKDGTLGKLYNLPRFTSTRTLYPRTPNSSALYVVEQRGTQQTATLTVDRALRP